MAESTRLPPVTPTSSMPRRAGSHRQVRSRRGGGRSSTRRGRGLCRAAAVGLAADHGVTRSDKLWGGNEVEPANRFVEILRPDPQPVLRVDAEVILGAMQRAGAHVDAVALPPGVLLTVIQALVGDLLFGDPVSFSIAQYSYASSVSALSQIPKGQSGQRRWRGSTTAGPAHRGWTGKSPTVRPSR
jgi:hypothetical protein